MRDRGWRGWMLSIGAVVLGLLGASAREADAAPTHGAAAKHAAAWAPEPARYAVTSTQNVPITMADGTVLRADVYSPADPATGKPAAGTFPVIVGETPYGKETATAPSPANLLADYDPYLVQRGYIFAIVDVRGTGASGGSWDVLQPQEAADSARVVDWASRLPRASGKVGMFGVSYGGLDQLFAAGAVGRNSPLKAIFPIMAGNDVYRELTADGGMLNAESDPAYLGSTSGANVVNPAAEDTTDPTGMLGLMTQHASATATATIPLLLSALTGGDKAYDGAYWQARAPINVLQRIVRNHVAAYLVGGLYDVYQAGEPRNLSGLQNAVRGRPVSAPMAPGQKVSGRYQLLLGPWYHMTFDTAEIERTALAWFDRWLKNEPTGIDRTTTPLHVIGADQQRHDYAGYPDPAATPTTFYLGANGTLDAGAPAATAGEDPIAFSGASLPCNRETEQFAIGAGELALSYLGLSDPCAAHDILPATGSPVRQTYTSAPLAKTKRLAGPIDATLYATADTTDTEWVVQLEDVAPDGSAVELTGGALLGSMRAVDASRTWTGADRRPLLPYHPYTQASVAPVTPGALTRYDIEVRPTFATLPAGHRLRLVVSTSALPRLTPRADQLANLVGGVYELQRSAGAASYLHVPLERG